MVLSPLAFCFWGLCSLQIWYFWVLQILIKIFLVASLRAETLAVMEVWMSEGLNGFFSVGGSRAEFTEVPEIAFIQQNMFIL